MFFFIAGIQPKTVTVDDQPRLCPSCGLSQARIKRIDHYLSVFFLPFFRVKKGAPFLNCERCGKSHGETGEVWSEFPQDFHEKCPNCRKPLKSAYRFCPYCGTRLRDY